MALGKEYWLRKKEAMAEGRRLVNAKENAEQRKRLDAHGIMKQQTVNELTKNLDAQQKKLLFILLEQIGKKSKLGIKFKKVFKTLPADQQHDILKTVKSVQDVNMRKKLVEVALEQAKALQTPA